jgi:hypothetical protein
MTQSRWLTWLSPVLLLVLWEVAVQLNLLNRVFIPPPSEVMVALTKALRDGSMQHDVLVSSQRIVLGFVIGAVPGTLLGIWSGLNRTVLALVAMGLLAIVAWRWRLVVMAPERAVPWAEPRVERDLAEVLNDTLRVLVWRESAGRVVFEARVGEQVVVSNAWFEFA